MFRFHYINYNLSTWSDVYHLQILKIISNFTKNNNLLSWKINWILFCRVSWAEVGLLQEELHLARTTGASQAMSSDYKAGLLLTNEKSMLYSYTRCSILMFNLIILVLNSYSNFFKIKLIISNKHDIVFTASFKTRKLTMNYYIGHNSHFNILKI